MIALFAKSNMKVISLLIPLLLILVYSRAAKGFHNFLAPLDGAMQTHFIIITLSFLTHLHRENSLKSTLPISNQESLPKCRLFRDVVRAHGRYIFGRYTFRCCILSRHFIFGHLNLLAVTLLEISPSGCYTFWMFHLRDVSPSVCFTFGMFHLRDVSPSGCFTFKMFHLRAVTSSGSYIFGGFTFRKLHLLTFHLQMSSETV